VARATRLGYGTLDDYYDALGRDDREFNELLNLVTINETSFFRFPAQFDALRDRVVPEVMARKKPGDRDLRVWSAGCSTGEEPYSIAMTLLDTGITASGWKPQVLGTDVSTKALARAKSGVYGKRAMMNIAPDVVSRYFERTMSGEYRVNDRVRSLVDFGYQNLIKEPYPLSLMGGWDIIFCRNVTIYFRIESTRRVVRNFYDSLNEGGYLFIALRSQGGGFPRQYLLQFVHSFPESDLNVGLHGMDISRNQLGCSWSTDLHGVDNGAVGQQGGAGSYPVLFIAAVRFCGDRFKKGSLIRPHLPDMKALALAEVLINHGAVGGGKCDFHNSP